MPPRPFSLLKIWFTITSGIVDLIYPPVCLLCETRLPEADQDESFCSDCRAALATDSAEQCPLCAATIGPHTDVSEGCPRCRNERFRFDGACRLGRYEGLLRRTILAIKHPGNEVLADRLGCFWAAQCSERLRKLACDLVVPVPLHWLRRWQRGYNQAETLAMALARHLALPCHAWVLWRQKATLFQYQQTRTERRKQMRGAFVARLPRRWQKSRILLVDDVLTTGSTCSEAARALKAAGAKEVFVAVLARADI